MNWDALGAFAEVVGAVGVIASLVYVSIQLKQNTQSIRDSTVHEVVRDYALGVQSLNADPELITIFYKGLKDLDSLTELERQRFETSLSSSLRLYENIVY